MAIVEYEYDFAINGVSEEELENFQIFNSRFKDLDDPRKLEKVIAVNSWDLEVDYAFGLEINEANVLRIRTNKPVRIGSIYYKSDDKYRLVNHLIMSLTAGYHFFDLDLADEMPIFIKGCEFSCIEAEKETCLKEISDFFSKEFEKYNPDEKDVFIHLVDAPLPLIVDIDKLSNDLNYHNFFIETTETDNFENNMCQAGIFITK